MFEVREYRKGDIFKVIMSEPEVYFTRYTREDVLMEHLAFTCQEGNSVVGCAGFVELWATVYEAWIAVDKTYKQNLGAMIFVLRSLRKSFDVPFLKEAQRVHAFVNSRINSHENFMRFLGFKPEAVLHSYFPYNSNAVVYRRM